MSPGQWIVSTVAEPATAHDTEAAANRAAKSLAPMVAVVWWCSDGAEGDVFAPVGDSSGGVVLASAEVLEGPQIETREIA